MTAVLATAFGGAEKVEAASLLDVYDAALREDPDIKIAEAAVDLGNVRVRNALIRYFPRAYFQYERTRINQRIIESENTIFDLGEASYTNHQRLATFTQPILDFERIVFAQREQVGRDRVLAEFAAERQRVIIRVTRRYLESLAALQRVDLLETALTGARAELDRARIAERDGLITNAELKSVEATSFLAQSELSEARAIYQNSLEAIGEVTGYQPLQVAPFARQIPVHRLRDQIDALVEQAMSSNTDLRAQNLRVLEAERERDRLIAQNLPRVEVVGTYDYQDRGGSEFGGGRIGEDATVALRVRVPIFNADGEGFEARVGEARRQVELEKLDKERRRIVREVRDLYRLINAAPTKVSALRKSVEARTAAEKDSRRLRDGGLATSVDILKAQRERLRAERDLYEAELRYLLDVLSIKSLSGGVAEDFLVYIDGMLAGDRSWKARVSKFN